MVKLFVSVLISLFFLRGGFCQNKVLVHSRDTSSAAFYSKLSKIQAAIYAKYERKVDVAIGAFPETLDEYDAIFTDLRFYDFDSMEFINHTVDKLTTYLRKKDNLYIEMGDRSFILHLSSPAFSTFAGLIGYSGNGGMNIDRQAVESVDGIDGFFTEGMHYQHTGDSVRIGNAYDIVGDVEPILKTNIVPAAYIAWQHQKENRKVVYHWPYVDDHYDEFIGRVICDYFDLCAPLEVVDTEVAGAFSVTYDPVEQKIDLHHAEDFHTVEVYSMLGIRLLTGPIDGESISISHSLPSGNYLVVARGAGRVGAKPVVIWK